MGGQQRLLARAQASGLGSRFPVPVEDLALENLLTKLMPRRKRSPDLIRASQSG